MMDEIKKENFDLKLRVSLLQERLMRVTPENVEGALSENVELKVRNETLMTENRTYKSLVNEAHGIVEQLRLEQAKKKQDTVDAGAVVALKAELEQSQNALMKAQVSIQRYESQMSLFDKESRENAHKLKQLELDLSSSQHRLQEAHNAIDRYKTEIVSLEEELSTKSETLKKFKEDISASTSDISLFSRQMQELQDRLKRSEAEKEELLRDKDRYRKGLEKAESHLRVNATLSSPARNSLDVLESKLLKELGNAHRRVNDLEKQTNLSQGEREQLIAQARRTGQDLMIGIKSMQLLAGKLVEVAFPGREISEAASLEEAVEVVEGLCRDVLVELEDSRLTVKDLDAQFARVSESLTASNRERDQVAASLSAAQVQLQKVSLELTTRASELRGASDTNRALQQRLRDLTEAEIPKWQREAEKATERANQLGHFVDNYEATLKATQSENEELGRKCSHLQQAHEKAQNEAAELRDFAHKLQEQRDELTNKLAAQEAVATAAQNRLDELQGRVGHTEKVKSAVEEKFQRELRALHATNGELKGQLGVALSARNELNQRIDRLSSLLREAERANDESADKSRNTENSLAALKREHEILGLEHKTLQNDLNDRQAALVRLESEIARFRREDQISRRTHDGLEHLQAKVESLAAMNSFLKDQTETRERTIRALEDRLRHQQEEMRRSREEVDAQTKKLKKREILIAQALKRLENINHLKQVQQATTDSFRDDHHPSLATPTKQPPSKRTNNNTNSYLDDEY
jgi:chromosome segregation ATPase